MALHLSCRRGTMPIVEACGELDLHTQTALRDELEQLVKEDHAEVGIDLEKVDFIDSAGVKLLRDIGATMRKAGHRLVLSEASPQVRRVLSVVRAAGFLKN